MARFTFPATWSCVSTIPNSATTLAMRRSSAKRETSTRRVMFTRSSDVCWRGSSTKCGEYSDRRTDRGKRTRTGTRIVRSGRAGLVGKEVSGVFRAALCLVNSSSLREQSWPSLSSNRNSHRSYLSRRFESRRRTDRYRIAERRSLIRYRQNYSPPERRAATMRQPDSDHRVRQRIL